MNVAIGALRLVLVRGAELEGLNDFIAAVATLMAPVLVAHGWVERAEGEV